MTTPPDGVDSIRNATERLLAAVRRGPAHDVERALRPLWEASPPPERVIISAVISACRPDR